MGAKLLSFYEEAKKIGGTKAQMRLAIMTTVTSGKAETIPDSPDIVSRFEKALNLIRAEG